MADEIQTTRLTKRRFVNRMGRTITDPEVIEARVMSMQLHRLETVGRNSGREWPQQVRVHELASAAKLSVERVLAIIRRFGSPWLIGLIEEGQTENWWVYQDGE